jgi:nitrite reductase/ring-hydroxylating ferredoxin subunit
VLSNIAINPNMIPIRFMSSPLSPNLPASRLEIENGNGRQILLRCFQKTCFDTIHSMQSFDTEKDHTTPTEPEDKAPDISAPGELQTGECARMELPGGGEVAVFDVDGEYYAIDNFCPHKGAPLSEGVLCGYVIECALHGWQFDVRTGECLTVPERIRTYRVTNVDGVLTVEGDCKDEG